MRLTCQAALVSFNAKPPLSPVSAPIAHRSDTTLPSPNSIPPPAAQPASASSTSSATLALPFARPEQAQRGPPPPRATRRRPPEQPLTTGCPPFQLLERVRRINKPSAGARRSIYATAIGPDGVPQVLATEEVPV
ncbi:hypothetical protein K491DRAFT_709768 [Lophiostoma macrostomum CBS 122681]|uniref:Uncharacterized protein n=1 Tax=Lophiostoma macrostomum CBS 122681 TaxID=1314788 RepID=A0A6A6TU07_9PLEO|nr:hypothetical protein K491DRAFT_709768 [Lophiostoma macrostomum CBS 122681]